jgi:glycosyltransferase involved in cell wall biosynthesis
MPHLSIITVNLNNADGLRKTIESVVNQLYSDFEYIIIDGGSTDGSVDVIREYTNKITYWISEPDSGIYNAMNKGILKAKGVYLNFLNSGDWFLDQTILQKLFSIDYNADILYGDVNHVNENGILKLYSSYMEENITLAYFYKHEFSHQAAFIRRHLFSSGLYDESFKIVSDWKFFIDRIVFKNCSIKKINLVIINYNMSGISTQIEYLNLHNAEREKVILQLVPDRIAKDYSNLILFSDSPLVQHMPFLNKTTGFHIFIAKIVGASIKIYKILRSLRKRTTII